MVGDAPPTQTPTVTGMTPVKDRVWRPVMIVPVPWQQLGVPREAGRWPVRDLVHSLRRTTCSSSRRAHQHPDPSAPLSALTPRLGTLSHRIIGIPSVPDSRRLTTSPAARCPVITPAEAA